MTGIDFIVESASLTADVSGIFREYAVENGKAAVPTPEAIAKSALLIHKSRLELSQDTSIDQD